MNDDFYRELARRRAQGDSVRPSPVPDDRIPPVRLLVLVLSMVFLYVAIGGWVLSLLGVIR